MAKNWMRGFKLFNSIILRNLNFIQSRLPSLPKTDTEKTTNIFVRKPEYGGLTEVIYTAATTSLKSPTSPGGNKGGGAKHNDNPGGKGEEKAGKDRVSDSKNLEKKQEEINNK